MKLGKKLKIFILVALTAFFFIQQSTFFSTTNNITSLPFVPPVGRPTPTLPAPPMNKILVNNYHIFQSFNNCGPAALSMALSYYGINVSQQELGENLRPYQNPAGDNDDKSVTLEELAEKSKEYDFIPYHRPNGSVELIKQFIAHDMPIITRTWLKENEDIGHYRVVKGYDEQQLLQDDSLQGANLWYSYNDFNTLWKKFNYEYLVLVPQDKEEIARQILGLDADKKIAWQKAVETSLKELQQKEEIAASSFDKLRTPRNDVIASDSEAIPTQIDEVTTRFNLSIAYYHTGEYRRSVEEFEKVESSLPFRTLWYQIEPIKAYVELKNYDRVFEITDKILNNYNRAFSELYIIRGNIYKEKGDIEVARNEFQKAVFYNINLKSAHEALNSL